MIPDSEHDEALTGDTLFSASFNYEWRRIVIPAIIYRLDTLAATIEDETDRQEFEVRCGALIDDLYNV